jgi:sugar lactone lactonase YvrE
MKKFFVFIVLLTGGVISLLLSTSCNTSNPAAPNFQGPLQTVVALNPTLTGTPTYTSTSTPTFTFTFTPSFTPTPYFTTTWPGILTFKHPSAIAAGSSSIGTCNNIPVPTVPFIYVADTGNNKIEKYTTNGTLVSNWGNSGKGKGSISIPNPIGVAVDTSDNLYVVCAGSTVVSKFNCSGNYVTQYTSADGVNFSSPQGVAVDNLGNVYISDTGKQLIMEVTSAWANVTSVSTASLSVSIYGLAGDGNGDVCVGTNGDAVYLYSATNPGPNFSASTPQTILQFSTTPHDVAFDSNNILYVTDTASHVVYEFANNISSQPVVIGAGTLVSPVGVAVDSNLNVYVIDSAGNGGYGNVVLFAP